MRELGVIPPMYKPFNIVPCALSEPPHKKYEDIYDLYCCAGSIYEGEKLDLRSIWRSCLVSTGRYGFSYAGGDLPENWIPWQIPEWSIDLAGSIISTINQAEQIGREQGYNSGVSAGKNFIKQLGNGELSIADFNQSDGRDDRRLTRKKW